MFTIKQLKTMLEDEFWAVVAAVLWEVSPHHREAYYRYMETEYRENRRRKTFAKWLQDENKPTYS